MKAGLSQVGKWELTLAVVRFVFCPSTGSRIGTKHHFGQLAGETGSVLVVLNDLHAYTEYSSYYVDETCDDCGERLI